MLMATLLGYYSGPRAACSLGLVEPKAKERSTCISLLRLPFLQSLLFVFPPRKICKQRLAWFVVSRFLTNTWRWMVVSRSCRRLSFGCPTGDRELLVFIAAHIIFRTWGEHRSSLTALPAAAGSRNLENPSWAPSRIRFRARPSSGSHKRDTLPTSRSGCLFSRQSASYPWDEGRRLRTSAG